MRKTLLLFAVAVIGHCQLTLAQSACTQTLRLAQSVYDQGRLQELPNLIENCLKNGFTDQEKVNAYKLLTLTYIYLEEPEKADDAMLALLRADNEFAPNDAVDPAELVALYHTFRTNPIYRIGLKAGTVASQPNVISADFVSSSVSEYTYSFGLNIAVAAEIPLKRKFKNFNLNTELSFQTRVFNGHNSKGDTVRTTTSTEKQNWISLPISLQRDIYQKGEFFKAYVSGGFSAEYLLSASKTMLSERTGYSPVEERPIDLKEQRNKFNVGLIVSGGIKRKISKGFLIVEARYQYGLMPALTKNDVYKDLQSVIDYKSVDGIYKLNTLSLSVGYVLNRYNPKKLTN
jgi:hypothetical protein